MCSENANSVLKNRYSTLRKCKFCAQNGNSTLRKWNSKQTAENSEKMEILICTQEIEIPWTKMQILRSENGKFSHCHVQFPCGGAQVEIPR